MIVAPLWLWPRPIFPLSLLPYMHELTSNLINLISITFLSSSILFLLPLPTHP